MPFFLEAAILSRIRSPGEHQPIIDQALWDRVQGTLDSNRVERRVGAHVNHPSLLAGLLYDDRGARMTPSHAVKNGKRYRYYVSEPLIKSPRDEHPHGRRIPAGDIEHLIVHRLRTFLTDRAAILASTENEISDAVSQDALLQSAKQLAAHLADAAVQEVRSIMLALIDRIDVHAGKLDVHLRRHLIVGVLQHGGSAPHLVRNSADDDEILTLTVNVRLKRAGMEKKMIVDGTRGPGGKHKRDAALIKLLVRAHGLKEKLLSGDGASLTRLAETEGITRSYFTRLLRLGFLAPDITKAIFNGTQPPTLTANKLMSDTRLPLEWPKQRNALGFA